MKTTFLCHKEEVTITVPDDSLVYVSHFPLPLQDDAKTVMNAVAQSIGSESLSNLIKNRKDGKVVVVVSDITRPIPYHAFLPQFLDFIKENNVAQNEIILLIATGMHRVSTYAEHVEMFGKTIADTYKIIDHDSENTQELCELKEAKSWSGNPISLNRHIVEAGLKITTGLVEPHFMAGFSGGRKAICPGLSSFETVQNFHSYKFLADERACNGNLKGNPLHQESLSVAKALGVDFSLNVVLNDERRVIKAFAGDIEKAHIACCDFVAKCACPCVREEVDVVLTSSGGYPLDSTFYQCVKGMVSCLPAVKKGGTIISFAGCCEGIGSDHYKEIMRKYNGKSVDFLKDIKEGLFIKDQWQYQMQCRTLDKIGQENLFFVTEALDQKTLDTLSVNGKHTTNVQQEVQSLIDGVVAQGKKIAVFPEGPYCGPLSS